MPLSADSKADSKAESGDARRSSLERALKPGAHAAAEHQSKWLDALASAPRLRRFSLWTDQRLALGLANGVLENAGLDLHRFWGTPEISGSKLKGVAADAARELVPDGKLTPVDQLAIFGAIKLESGKAVSDAGRISFLAAHPAHPDCRLELDVLTVHFPAYYAGTRTLDTEDDNPIPAPFPVVAEGQEFVFHLLCRDSWLPDDEATRLLNSAEACLRHALTHQGVGGKTRAGYGRFRAASERVAPPEPADDLFATEAPEVSGPSLHSGQPVAPRATAADVFAVQWSAGALVPESIKRFSDGIKNLPMEQRLSAFNACVPAARRTSDDKLWQAFKSRHHGINLLKELKLG